MGFLDRIEARFKHMGDRARDLDEMLSHFSGNLTEAIKAENRRGKELADSFFELVPALEDDPNSGFLTRIHMHLMETAGKLDKNFGNPERRWHINIVDNESMLACCLPGGYIIVDRSMVDYAKTAETSDQAQLAFILAHESAHLLLGHTTSKLYRELGMRVGVSFITAATVLGTLANGIAYGVAMSIVEGSYSRTQEFQADHLAVHLLKRSGVDPRGGIGLFRRLEDEYPDVEAVPILKYFASHPPGQERVDKMEEEIAAIEERKRKRKG